MLFALPPPHPPLPNEPSRILTYSSRIIVGDVRGNIGEVLIWYLAQLYAVRPLTTHCNPPPLLATRVLIPAFQLQQHSLHTCRSVTRVRPHIKQHLETHVTTPVRVQIYFIWECCARWQLRWPARLACLTRSRAHCPLLLPAASSLTL